MAEAAEFTLTDKQLVRSLTGCGVQFNQHSFAAITGAPADSFADLEEKVLRLAPQFVRLFFNDIQGDGVRGGPRVPRNRFCAPSWLGRPGRQSTSPGNQGTSSRSRLARRACHVCERARKAGTRLREQIRFMAGDLIRASANDQKDNQKLWFDHMDKNLAGLLDAYSVHIYWDYFRTDKFEDRLQEVLKFVKKLRNTKSRPIFITEYGVRGRRGPNRPAPGIFKDGTPACKPLSETNIAASQQAWFLIRTMQLGYVGTIKWDCFFGTYDSTYRKKHYVIGPPTSEGWPLYPMYHLLRLITLTTDEGWQVVHLKSNPATGMKKLAALKGPGNQLTILGLHSRGAKTNSASQTQVSYTIDTLRPNAPFTLLIWNRAGGGQLVSDGMITADGAALQE